MALTNLANATWRSKSANHGLDRIVIWSGYSVARLKATLPMALLRKLCHSFADPVRHKRHDPSLPNSYASEITIVCGPDSRVLDELLAREHLLGRYKVHVVEVKREQPQASEQEAVSGLPALVGQLRKTRQRRDHLNVYHCVGQPKPGCYYSPTFYFEDKRAGVAFKPYARQRKLNRGRFGDPIIQLEWTLTGSAVKRHLGGNQLSNLIAFDAATWASKQLKLETINLLAIGKLFERDRTATEEQLRRTAHVHLELLGYEHCNPETGEYQLAPSTVRKALRAKGFSQYQVDKCFQVSISKAKANPSTRTKPGSYPTPKAHAKALITAPEDGVSIGK